MTERSASSPAVHCSALTKDYGNGRGIFGFHLAVGAREVFGYIGPNGAGKTLPRHRAIVCVDCVGEPLPISEVDCILDHGRCTRHPTRFRPPNLN